MKTNFSRPTTNIFAGLNQLRHALAYGMRVKLIRIDNADCTHPILNKQQDQDFRNYEFSSGHAAARTTINADKGMSDFQKHLSLNYVNCYGTQEAVDNYYKTGVVVPDNHLGIGVSHLVLATDLITMMLENQDKQRADRYQRQYTSIGFDDFLYFYDFYRYKHDSPYAIRKFKRKVWAVAELETGDKVSRAVKVFNFIIKPLQLIPSRDVLKMGDYKVITYRVGSIKHGYSMELTIPKKFSFKED